jgi:plastocyanin
MFDNGGSMKRLLLSGIALLVTALAVGWLPGGGASVASAATVNVDVGDNVFTPGMITITAGDTVHWAWSGSNPHSVESTSSEAFSSSVQTSGTFDHTFNTAGTFTYQCGVHGAAMSGTVVVQAAAAPTNTAVPASSNTPTGATNTPAAGATIVPADTPPVASAEAGAGTPAAGGTVAAGAATPTRTGGAVLPATGGGDDSGSMSRTWLAGVLALAGLAVVALTAGMAITRRR